MLAQKPAESSWLQYIPLVTAAIALISVLAGAVVNHILDMRKQRQLAKLERQKLLWTKRLDFLLEVESRAGALVDLTVTWMAPSGEQHVEEVRSQYLALFTATGRVGRYPGVIQAIKDLMNSMGRWLDQRGDWDSRQEYEAWSQEAKSHYHDLLRACEEVYKSEW